MLMGYIGALTSWMLVMEANLYILSLSISCLFLYLGIKKFIWKNGNLPPGPTPLPVLGNYLQLRNKDYVTMLINFRHIYGDVCTIYLGSRPVILVIGYQAVKEVLHDRGDDFLVRGDIATFDAFFCNFGIIFTKDMNWWRELRCFSISALKDFGMGKKTMEERIQEEAACLVKELQNTKGAAFDSCQCLNKPPCNVLLSLMFGIHQEYEDEELPEVLKCINETFVTISSIWGQLFEVFPGLMRLLPGKHQLIFKNLEKLSRYVAKRVKMNEETLDPDNPRDYIDAFLIKMEKEKSNPRSAFTQRNQIFSTLQIFLAAAETVSATLRYCLLLLLKYPDILTTVQEEIDQTIDRSHRPTFQDLKKMPYTEAVIHEMQRFITLLPLGAPRKTTRDILFHGYSIPKGTNILPILASVHKDPSCFPYPSEFNPRNFLDENGHFKNSDAFIPFSAGKRHCIGEGLVKMQLYLYIVTILQNFTLKSPVPIDELDITPDASGLGNIPKPYKIAFITR